MGFLLIWLPCLPLLNGVHAVLLLPACTGEDVTVDMEKNVLINHTTGKEYALKELGDVSVACGGRG